MLWLSIERCRSLRMYQRRMRNNSCFYLTVLLLNIFIIIRLDFRLWNIEQDCSLELDIFRQQKEQQRISSDSLRKNQPMIFIGGMQHSGTTLMSIILDAHPLVCCKEETTIISTIVNMRTQWKSSASEANRLIAGGMTDALIDSSIRAFIYEIIAQHSKFADVLCDKDPSVWKYAQYISKLFPNAKFLLLIRDARAIIHSIMTRNLTIAGFSLTDYRQNLKSWNNGISIMVSRCKDFGQNQCFMVYYEQLVLQPKKTIESIFKFLNLSMVDSVLPHEELVGKKISFSKAKYSFDQVIKPINPEALTKWVNFFPNDVKKEFDTLAPMLKTLGYDTKSNVPTYGIADQLKENSEFSNAKAKP